MKREHEEALKNAKEAFTACGLDSLARIEVLVRELPALFDLINWQREEIERLNAELAKQTKEALHWRNNHNADESL